MGVLLGVIAPGAMSADASPSHGSAAAPAAHGNGAKGGAAPNTGQLTLTALQSSSSASVVSSTRSSAALKTNSQGSNGKGGTVHAASLQPNPVSGVISIPGNCQSPQCDAVLAELEALITTTATPTAPAATTTTTTPPSPARTRSVSLAHVGTTPRALVSATRPVSAGASPPAKSGPTVLQEPFQLATGGWEGVSLKAASDLRVPILFGAAVLLFVLLQAFVDRRDPKMSRAPERDEDDSVGFS